MPPKESSFKVSFSEEAQNGAKIKVIGVGGGVATNLANVVRVITCSSSGTVQCGKCASMTEPMKR